MDLFYWTQIFRFTFKKSLLNREWFISLLAVKLHNKVMCHENKLHDIDSTWHHVLWHKDTRINFHMSLFYWHKTPPWRCTHVRQVFHHVPFYVPPKEHFQCKDSNIKFWSKYKASQMPLILSFELLRQSETQNMRFDSNVEPMPLEKMLFIQEKWDLSFESIISNVQTQIVNIFYFNAKTQILKL